MDLSSLQTLTTLDKMQKTEVGSGYTPDGFPGITLTSAHILEDLQLENQFIGVCRAIYVLPWSEYAKIKPAYRRNREALARAGAVRIFEVQSLRRPVAEIAAQCVKKQIARRRIAVQLDCWAPTLRHCTCRQSPAINCRCQVTHCSLQGSLSQQSETALVLGVPNLVPAYITLGPASELETSTTFPGGVAVQQFEELFMRRDRLDDLLGLSGGPVLVQDPVKGGDGGSAHVFCLCS